MAKVSISQRTAGSVRQKTILRSPPAELSTAHRRPNPLARYYFRRGPRLISSPRHSKSLDVGLQAISFSSTFGHDAGIGLLIVIGRQRGPHHRERHTDQNQAAAKR